MLASILAMADDAGGKAARPGQSTTATATDAILGGRLHLEQPRKGLRAGSDAILLAAAVAGRPGQRILDVGTGVGAVGLAIAQRLPECQLSALELQSDLAVLAQANAARNGLADRFQVWQGDITDPPIGLRTDSFDHVVSNPPYFTAERHRAAPDPARATARQEGECDLASWVDGCLKRLVSKGQLTMIQRSDRLAELLAALSGRAGDIVLYPLWPKPTQPATRFILRAHKGRKGPLRILPGLLMHDDDGAYSAAAEAVLRHGAALDFTT